MFVRREVIAMLSAASLAACASLPRVPREGLNWQGYVPIGGIDQWITITGEDGRNPVVLFLHGGPGVAASPFAAGGYAGWEHDFTLVQWDQRGAGRTFARNRARAAEIERTMTFERMVEDGIEIADHLRRRLGKNKVILTGGSWGSILGIAMAHARPDLFHAYVGTAQATNWLANRAASYAKVREIALSKPDPEALATLDRIGPPPWRSTDQSRPFRQIQIAYQRELATAPPPPLKIASEYQADFDDGSFKAAMDYSDSHFFGSGLSGPINDIDIRRLTDFAIPVFIIQGAFDLTIPPEEAKAYFDTINAPTKEFLVAPGSGHEPTMASQDMLHDVLLKKIRPLALR